MSNIYIDINKKEIIIKDNRDKLVNKYSNLSTNNKGDISKSLKLFMTALNKIFLVNKYNEFEYTFNINDKELINIITLENDNYRESIIKEWHSIYNKDTVSELGTFLFFLKKIDNKNILYWERTELFQLQDEKEKLYCKQSKCDIEIQDILHLIQELSIEDINAEKCIALVYKLKELRLIRNNIKKEVKKIEYKERLITKEKNKKKKVV